jgi:glycogen debranching enzyme
MDEWKRTVLKIETSNEEFYRCYDQGVQDMAALRLPLQGTDHMVFVPAAGLPWFVALFGRDTLIVSLQTMIVYPEFAAGTLEVLAQYQATERMTTATPSRARSCTNCVTANWRILS